MLKSRDKIIGEVTYYIWKKNPQENLYMILLQLQFKLWHVDV